MMMPDRDINLSELLRAAMRFWPLVAATSVAFGLAALLISLSGSRLFICQTLVALPEVCGRTLSDSCVEHRQTLFSVAETRIFLADFQPLGGTDAYRLDKVFHSVRLSQSGSSGAYFSMQVISRKEPAAAEAISEEALIYLQNKPEVRERVGRIRRKLLEEKSLLEGLLVRLSRIKGGADKDQVAIETAVASTKIALTRADYDLSTLRTYRFVSQPALNPDPIPPKPEVRAAAFSVIGFIVGLFAAGALDTAKKARKISLNGK